MIASGACPCAWSSLAVARQASAACLGGSVSEDSDLEAGGVSPALGLAALNEDKRGPDAHPLKPARASRQAIRTATVVPGMRRREDIVDVLNRLRLNRCPFRHQSQCQIRR